MAQPTQAKRARPQLTDRNQLTEEQVRIVEVCTELFGQQGYHQTSVRAIVEALDWPMGALYQHVRKKSDILEMVGHVIMNDLSRGLWELKLTGSHRERLDMAIRYFFTTVDRMRAKVKLIYRESASLGDNQRAVLQEAELTSREVISRVVRDGIAAGEFSAVDATMVAHDIIALGHMWALKGWALWPGNIDIAEYTDFHADLILRRLSRAP